MLLGFQPPPAPTQPQPPSVPSRGRGGGPVTYRDLARPLRTDHRLLPPQQGADGGFPCYRDPACPLHNRRNRLRPQKARTAAWFDPGALPTSYTPAVAVCALNRVRPAVPWFYEGPWPLMHLPPPFALSTAHERWVSVFHSPAGPRHAHRRALNRARAAAFWLSDVPAGPSHTRRCRLRRQQVRTVTLSHSAAPPAHQMPATAVCALNRVRTAVILSQSALKAPCNPAPRCLRLRHGAGGGSLDL